ncbi:putative nonribosomal peptide synthase [Xylariales sp. AK1849]|nr:putative nonribosomal peptide synthase [Xylariales sp. AK1849]
MVQSAAELDEAPTLDEGPELNTYAITLHSQIKDNSLLTKMVFDPTALSERVASRVVDHFGHILRQICRADTATTRISDIDAMTPEDLGQVWTWNANVPEEVNGCVHHLFSQIVFRYPNRTAICAWDGELTYAEWDKLSTELAHRLIHRGVCPGDLLPLIFEKSMWVAVSQFAVMKAGAASVVIDPSQTEARIRTMIDIAGPGLILCSPSTAPLVSRITERKPFVVQKETVSGLPEQSRNAAGFETSLPAVKPSDLLYVVFTSGTTGYPKGVAIKHSNFTSAVRYQNEYLNFKPTARVADFCSYAFDVSWSNFIHTLAAGACLCVPSELDRKHDFVGYMIKNEVTCVHLTPSVAAILDLEKVPTLNTLLLGGETIDLDKMPHLKNIETITILYGPAECTVDTTGVIINGGTTHATIGWAIGSTTWIADPSKDALTPVGLIGELLLEGPLVGAGYLNNAEKAAAAFIEDPSWLLRGSAEVKGRRGRLYRTGDLVRYSPDGELIYLGRKDTQVKIRGQRTELGDVEHHIRRVLGSMTAVADIVAEVVTPKITQRPMLVAFLNMPTTSTEQLRKKSAPIIEMLEMKMLGQVPSHMIPTAYIPMADLPRGLTGKTDRRALREIGAGLDRNALAPAQHIEPTTEAEMRLRDLWASVLNLPASDIGKHDSFLRIGGDSIAAIRLATYLGRMGMWLTVPDIYSQPQLSEMAKLMSRSDTPAPEVVRPFSLLKAEMDRDEACRRVAELCSVGAWHVEPSQIEDIFPCTPLQEGLLAMTARSAGKYVGHRVAELKPEIDIVRLRDAWQVVSERSSVLRTRIVDLPGLGLVQVVLEEALQWQTFSSLEEYYQSRKSAEKELQEHLVGTTAVGLGTPLSRVAIILDEAAGKRYLALTHHHATYDGWSIPLLQKEVETAYGGRAELSSLPMQSFVKYVMGQRGEDGMAFWKQQFAEIEASPFPALPAKTYEPMPDKVINHSIKGIRWPTCGVTPSSTLRAAWATLVSWYTDCPDVIFGVVVSGRQAPVPEIEVVAGPTIATIPLRILVRGTVDELLYEVQGQAMEMIPFEQYGLQHIRQISQQARIACDFQTLLLVHPSVEERTVESMVFEDSLNDQATDIGSENTYAMMLTCQPSESKLDLQLSFDSTIIEEEASVRLLQQLEHILGQIASDGSTNICDLERVSERDLHGLWKWNSAVPQSIEDCVHNVFAQRVAEAPEAPAVCAWDGELTYVQLDHFSTLLAGRLLSLGLGVGPGAIVPLCFEKSVWMPVAVLAVMKAGAASVALDITLPRSRLEGIVTQLSAKVMLTSKSCAKLGTDITDALTIEVGGEPHNFEQLYQPISNPKMPTVSPLSALYIVFTSGSTGAPKGATVTHANFCSAVRHHQPQLGFERSSRVFDYTSYAFDVAWSNVLHALTVGACLCIPSEDERTADIHGSINRLQANFIHLTPTVGRLLDPAALKGLKKVLFIGEALKASDVAKWEASGVEIYNTYGPAECTVTSTVERVQRGRSGGRVRDPGIGKGTGALVWVVQPRAPDRLAAIGTIGELWLEGPIVGAGYLNNPEKTASAFVEDPRWLLDGIPGRMPGRRGRLYRTGDLVYYNPDGSLGFVGRNDTQVKINGQRMELGEVECHIRQLLPTEVVPQIIVDVITPDATRTQTLAVFLVLPDDDTAKVELNEVAVPMIAILRKELSRLLPSYMVPGVYIPVPLSKLPMTATGKTDRQRLREVGRTYIPPVSLMSDVSTSNVMQTRTEEALRDIWAGVLDIKPNVIAAGNSFSEVGGDSIKVMSLAMAIHKHFDIKIGVSRLQQQNSLRVLAAVIDNLLRGQSVEEPTQPTSTDLEREIDLLVNKIDFSRSATRSTVFLTGSTGFLGTQILYYTLRKRIFDRVVLLVRSLDAQKGLDRVIKTAEVAGWWKESFTSTIEVWDGDLSAERLGLNTSQWSALCGRPSACGIIDTIIHNGARVHWTTNYDGLRDANVGSTIQLLQAVVASPFLKSFVYVSGGLITDSQTWTEEEAKRAKGYDQTKYVSERLVSAAATHFHEPRTTFSVVKPGRIIGDAYTGIANTDDFLWRVVMGAVRLGARPVDSETAWLSMSDVRHVTESILWHAAGKSCEHFVQIKRGVWVSAFWTAVEDQLQIQLRPVSWGEWIELAGQDMEREQELHPLWPVQQFLGALGSEVKVCDHESYEGEMREVLAAVRQNIEYLRGKGFLGTTGGKQINGKVISRTRNVRTKGPTAVGT